MSQQPTTPTTGSRDPRPEPLTPAELERTSVLLEIVLEELDRALLGHQRLHRLVLAAVLARGHVLLEGLPGVGKTMLVRRLGELLDLGFSRVQFTPDLMPGDILGTHILQETAGGRELVFRAGPVFTNLLLADEINRASPKTQSALLEAMQERTVTLLGETRPLPDPFFVLASQNPIELEGTYPLPEAQLDRFLLKLTVEPAGVDVLETIAASRRHGEPPPPRTTLARADIARLHSAAGHVLLPRAVARYVARLVAATHPGAGEAPELVHAHVRYGASPRAAIALAESARAVALLAGRPTVGFEDVREVAGPVLDHRLILAHTARMERIDAATVVASLLDELDPAGLDLPDDVRIGR